jgi:hypothetical protein
MTHDHAATRCPTVTVAFGQPIVRDGGPLPA